MNVTEEKEHIYSLMRDMTEERRKLTDMYYSLKTRLDDLNKFEQKGLEDLDLKGYVDLHNNNNRDTIVRNVERESKNVINKVNKESEELKEKEEHEKEPKFKKEIDNQKDSIKTPKKRKSIEYYISVVSEVLKEHGAPMSLSDLHKEVNRKTEADVSPKNFSTNIMYRINKKSTKIERVAMGYYQYRL